MRERNLPFRQGAPEGRFALGGGAWAAFELALGAWDGDGIVIALAPEARDGAGAVRSMTGWSCRQRWNARHPRGLISGSLSKQAHRNPRQAKPQTQRKHVLNFLSWCTGSGCGVGALGWNGCHVGSHDGPNVRMELAACSTCRARWAAHAAP